MHVNIINTKRLDSEGNFTDVTGRNRIEQQAYVGRHAE